MIKSVDLRSISSNTETEIFDMYSQYLGISLQPQEFAGIRDIASKISKEINLSHFYLGYTIPQIGKEFDLLTFDKEQEKIINIELKSEANYPETKILKQLQKNRYYLRFVYGDIHLYTYNSANGILYKLSLDGKQLENIPLSVLESQLKEFNPCDMGDLDNTFDPSLYLVSPFNTIDKFIAGEYFLTKLQNDNKAKLIDGPSGIFALKAPAGTGKTLLVYDIVRQYINDGKNTLLIHMGKLNEGQIELTNKFSWNILPVSSFQNKYSWDSTELNDYDLIVIDEAQRFSKFRIEDILNALGSLTTKIILSGDPKQVLQDKSEVGAQVFDLISERYTKQNVLRLSEKIRTNVAVAGFIRRFLNGKDDVSKTSIHTENIKIQYFSNEVEAVNYGKFLQQNEWEVLKYTPSRFDPEYVDVFNHKSFKNQHDVLGQEFDNVAVFVGANFGYDENWKLTSVGNHHYSVTHGLFENLTRTRKQLMIIIVNNPRVLQRALDILD